MKLCCLFLLLVLIPVEVAGAAQTPHDVLTATEELEVRRFVKSFTDQLQLTRNLSPFLNEPVARRVLDNYGVYDMGFVKPEIALRVGTDELRRFYLAMTNLAYLSNLYCYGNLSMKGRATTDLPYGKQYPPRVFRLLKSNPTLAVWWNKSGSSTPEKVVASVEQLRSLTMTWERAGAMMRRTFKSRPPERSKTYQNNLFYLAPYLNKIEVETCKTETDCAGFPVGTQFISVAIPILRLMLVRVNGQLKIMAIGLLDQD
ncbi:MAG: hypothetical protein ND895_07420 [Pyrinomonadaceae bacterium]|nr:hypothetical protein [Pyrinomonadaceae bacterium]